MGRHRGRGGLMATGVALVMIGLPASADAAPVNLAAPTITGPLQVGQTLTRSLGTWSDASALAYHTQWELCDRSGTECAPIPRATGSRLRLKKSEIGHQITAMVAATDRLGESASATASPVGPIGVSHYLDCASGNDASSGLSETTAWRTLQRADSVTYQPGDAILLRRGTRCVGVFAPRGSGMPSGPIVADAYGSGPRPQIAGEGVRTAVILSEVQGWVLRDLAISDEGETSEPGILRTGIEVSASRGDGYVIEGDEIVNVDSAPLPRTPGISLSASVAGIESTAGEAVWDFENRSKVSGGIQVSGGLSHVVIRNNTLTRTDREGIFIEGGGIAGLLIQNNVLREIGGDGIVAVGTEGALIEGNVVEGFNVEGTSFNAGVWSYASTDDVFQFNDVSGGQHGPEDTMAYDIDGSNRHIVYQYNLSHDNTGGFLMLCNNVEPFGTGSSNGGSIVRYNISQNDSAVGRAVIDAPFACATEQDISVYNNTVVTSDPRVTELVENTNESTAHFTDNILVGPGTQADITDRSATWQSNLYDDVTCASRPPDPGAVVANPMLLAPGTATSLHDAGGYQLRDGSPALGAGAIVADNGGRDFFGNPVPPDSAPNIGAYQGPGVAPSERLLEEAPGVAPGC